MLEKLLMMGFPAEILHLFGFIFSLELIATAAVLNIAIKIKSKHNE